jgi:magnesium-protoporphyrin IX monomethyl ester (oxidative) cyclase
MQNREQLKIVLVNPSNDNPSPNMGLCYLSSYLKKYSKFRNIKINDAGTQDIYKIDTNADLVGITSTTKDYKLAKEYARFLKIKKPEIKIILGGAHISTNPLDLNENIDIGVIGEGEQTFLEITECFAKNGTFPIKELKKIKGICFRNKGKIELTKERELIKNIDCIPFPDLDLLDMNHYLKPRQLIYGYVRKSMVMLTSRGCPYHCSFCSTSAIWKIFRGNSAEYVISQLKWIKRKYNPRVIQIFDDLFILDKERLSKIVNAIVKERLNKKIIFGCLCRADLLDEKTVRLLKAMNVKSIAIGMESASQPILDYLKNGTTKVKHLHDSIELCKKYKIKVFGSFMLGNPGETREDLMKTLRFIKAHPTLGILNYITTPLPKTKLWDDAIAKKKITSDLDISTLPMDIPSNFEEFKKIPILIEMDKKEFFNICMEFQKEFYSRLGKNYDLGLSFFSFDLIKRGLKKPKKTMTLLAKKILNR